MKKNSVEIITDIIVGYETKILQMLEKWNVSKKDIAEILELIALIEENTIRLVIERQKEIRYKKLLKKKEQI